MGQSKAVVSISFRWHVSIGDWFRPELPQDDSGLHPIKQVRRTPADSGIKSPERWWPGPCCTTRHYISGCSPIQFAPWNTNQALMSPWSVLGNKVKPPQMFCVRWPPPPKKKRGKEMFFDPRAGNRNTEVLQLIVNKKGSKEKQSSFIIYNVGFSSQSSLSCEPW